MQSADDDAIIGAWRDKILLDPNEYVLAIVGEVESKQKFGPFEDRLNHLQIQKDMILIAAHAIADATTCIAFLPTTDEKIETLNRLIAYYKRLKKSTWKNEQENMDNKIKKITAIDIFILMCKDLKNRLQTASETRRPSLFKTMFSKKSEPLTVLLPSYGLPGDEIGDPHLGGSKRKTKQRKIKKSRKSMNKRNKRRTKSNKSRIIRKTSKSRV